MLRRKAKLTIDALADESVCISIKSKNINTMEGIKDSAKTKTGIKN